jgi:inhibitor of KinA sporulation pathway (predicted exonuclease)
VTWVNRFNYRKSSYTAPIPVGFNINGYDMHILTRLCREYGPADKDGNQDLFNNRLKVDVMDEFFTWTEHNPDVKKRNLGAVMDFLGMPAANKENAHDALQDVKNTANIFIKLQKYKREISAKTNWGTSFANGELYIK